MFVITLIILAIAAYFLIQYLRNRADSGAAAGDPLGHDPQESKRPLPGPHESTGGEGQAAAREHIGAHPEKADSTLDAGDRRGSVREMMKILNLRASDASRLDITQDDFTRLWQADASAPESLVDEVSARLRSMLH